MGIYIKTNMKEMPNTCIECDYSKRYGCVGDVYCKALDDYFTNNAEPPYKEKPDKCPLVKSGAVPGTMTVEITITDMPEFKKQIARIKKIIKRNNWKKGAKRKWKR